MGPRPSARRHSSPTRAPGPWEWAESPTIGLNDLNHYAPRTDTDGPAITDSIHAIDGLALRVPGCPAYQFLLQSVLPFVQPRYDQFTEARNGQGSFTFLTGEGGFLQTLYGSSPASVGLEVASVPASPT